MRVAAGYVGVKWPNDKERPNDKEPFRTRREIRRIVNFPRKMNDWWSFPFEKSRGGRVSDRN